MRSGDAVTESERRAAEAERALEELRARQAAAREALAGRREQIVGERERAVVEREEAAGRVSGAMLARYERIRRGKAPLALYPLHGDACGHCFTAVPTPRRGLIQPGASSEACHARGALLYAPELAPPPARSRPHPTRTPPRPPPPTPTDPSAYSHCPVD